MSNCKWCGKDHNNAWSDFCSEKCKHKYAEKNNRRLDVVDDGGIRTWQIGCLFWIIVALIVIYFLGQ